MDNVLICDDDKAIRDSVAIYLKMNGYNALTAENGQQAITCAEENKLSCIILDIMMPGTDGLAATLKLREKGNVPIILLSAKSEESDKITGLSFGADDYVTKPFSPMELMARVKSAVRRYTSLGGAVSSDSVIVNGGLVLDADAKTVSVDGETKPLTSTEYGIVEYLMKNMGKVLSTSQIYEAVWNEPSMSSEKTVTVHIRRIREKIEIDPKDPEYIKVVWGIGYKMEIIK